jgi:DNA polymerase I-like protein with 3'-5' exonuclease and polymerase domains
MLFSMVKLMDELDPRDCFMVMTLHDAIMFECRDDMVGEYAPVIKQVMENLPLKKTFGCDLQVPIVADVEYGRHWGEYTGEVIDQESLV